MDRANLNALEPEYDSGDPEGYRAGLARFGTSIGASKIGASLYELPAGQSMCPYHYEYPNEEWLMVLEGRPTLRQPSGESELEPGDIICFPPGAAGAHKVTNRTEETIRVLMFSTKVEPAVVVYPDSDKIGIWPEDRADHVIVRRSSNLDYYDGEPAS